MDLEWHQLETPYASLRAHHRKRQGQLRLSIEEHGQRQPIVVVSDREAASRYIVIDGHQRIAALRRLGHDTVEALVWDMEASAALVLHWQMANGRRCCALEQGWLLAELQHSFGWSQQELAQKFGIMSIPNVILFHKGQIVDNSVGVRDKNFYASKLQTAIDG